MFAWDDGSAPLQRDDYVFHVSGSALSDVHYLISFVEDQIISPFYRWGAWSPAPVSHEQNLLQNPQPRPHPGLEVSRRGPLVVLSSRAPGAAGPGRGRLWCLLNLPMEYCRIFIWRVMAFKNKLYTNHYPSPPLQGAENESSCILLVQTPTATEEQAVPVGQGVGWALG